MPSGETAGTSHPVRTGAGARPGGQQEAHNVGQTTVQPGAAPTHVPSHVVSTQQAILPPSYTPDLHTRY